MNKPVEHEHNAHTATSGAAKVAGHAPKAGAKNNAQHSPKPERTQNPNATAPGAAPKSADEAKNKEQKQL